MYQTWQSFDCVVGTWVCALVFPEARTMGLCPCFLTHLECMLSVVVKTLMTIRVYANTYNMTPSRVSSMSRVTRCWV